MKPKFEDLRITGLDVNATEQSPTAPGLRLVHLNLSAPPTNEWTQIFAAERQFPRHSMWRRAYIEGGNIVVDCVPEELEQYHLKDLKEDVRNTNQKYRHHLTQEELGQQANEEAAKREWDRMEQVNRRLDFSE